MWRDIISPGSIGSFQLPVPLPTSDPNAGDQVCVQFGAAWLPLVRGALQQLMLSSTWDTSDPDDLLLALQRAASLIDLFSDDAECEMQTLVRTNPENNCQLDVSYDGGENWEMFANLYDCARAAASDEIADQISDGVLGARGQQPPGGLLGQAECHTYHVALRATDRWHCPVPVSSDFSIHVMAASGGWCDGTLSWWCPDGARYLLGTCSEQNHYHDENDPLQSAWHMAIIGALGSTPVYFDPLTSTYTVPSGYVNEEFVLQANDGSLSDNFGSVEFDVEICNEAQCPALDYDWTTLAAIAPWRVMDLPEGNMNYRNILSDQAANATFTIDPGYGLRGYGYQQGRLPICGVLELGRVCTLTHVDVYQSAGDCRFYVRQQGTWNSKFYDACNPCHKDIVGGENTDAVAFIHYAVGTILVQRYVLTFA
jgi:hypothetical protein